MEHPEIRITREPKVRRGATSAKGREFSSVLLAHLEADSLWDLGTNKTQRPVWISFVGSPSAARAFTANFRGGARASRHNSTRVEDSFEIPKSSGHRWVSQEVVGMTVTTAYLPSLFHVDPSVPGDDVRFIFMPPRWWVAAQGARLASTFGERAEDAARAALFAAYIDRRTRLPVLQELDFQLRLFEAAKKEDWLHRAGLTRYDRSVLYQEGVVACGLDAPLACWVRHEVLEAFLAGEVRRYYDEEVLPRGATRIDQDRRLLPGALRAAEQLCLDFSMAIG